MAAFSHKLDQITYPRMERQDLTQGQLGSFKFTPTDEVRHVFTKCSPGLAPSFVYPSTKHHMKSHEQLPLPLNVLSNGDRIQHHQPPAFLASKFGSTVFDTCFKPDLTNSRLRLGPTALRAAVDRSPTSPARQSTPGFTFHPINNMTSSSMDPIDLSPIRNDTAPPTAEPPHVIQTSLLQALLAEQTAHRATMEALEVERRLRLVAEAESQRHAIIIRSLEGTIGMLKGIVQHTMKKEASSTKEAASKSCDQAAKVPETIKAPLPDTTDNADSTITESAPKIDHNAHLFDFDHIDTYGPDSLRKHFSTPAPSSTPIQNKFLRALNKPDGDFRPVSKSSVEIHSKEHSGESWQSNGSTLAGVIVPTDMPQPSQTLGTDDIITMQKQNTSGRKVMAMPFDPRVKWSVSPVFDDEGDKHRRLNDQTTLFFKHPVRYRPQKSEKNLYRTVMIDFIPVGTTHHQVLDQIRGGAIESIQLFPPIGRSTDFLTARIVFNYELGARGVYMRGQSPGIHMNGKRVRVWQVLEATYPRSEQLERLVFEENFTRFLLIENAFHLSLQKLPEKLAHQVRGGFIVEIGKTYDDIPCVEFTSIEQCSKAFDQLMGDPDFGGTRFDFEEDPCDEPYE